VYLCRFLRQFPSAAVSFEAFFCVGCDKSKGLNKKQLAVSKDNKKTRRLNRRRRQARALHIGTKWQNPAKN
jgi:hypothetical protein